MITSSNCGEEYSNILHSPPKNRFSRSASPFRYGRRYSSGSPAPLKSDGRKFHYDSLSLKRPSPQFLHAPLVSVNKRNSKSGSPSVNPTGPLRVDLPLNERERLIREVSGHNYSPNCSSSVAALRAKDPQLGFVDLPSVSDRRSVFEHCKKPSTALASSLDSLNDVVEEEISPVSVEEAQCSPPSPSKHPFTKSSSSSILMYRSPKPYKRSASSDNLDTVGVRSNSDPLPFQPLNNSMGRAKLPTTAPIVSKATKLKRSFFADWKTASQDESVSQDDISQDSANDSLVKKSEDHSVEEVETPKIVKREVVSSPLMKPKAAVIAHKKMFIRYFDTVKKGFSIGTHERRHPMKSNSTLEPTADSTHFLEEIVAAAETALGYRLKECREWMADSASSFDKEEFLIPSMITNVRAMYQPQGDEAVPKPPRTFQHVFQKHHQVSQEAPPKPPRQFFINKPISVPSKIPEKVIQSKSAFSYSLPNYNNRRRLSRTQQKKIDLTDGPPAMAARDVLYTSTETLSDDSILDGEGTLKHMPSHNSRNNYSLSNSTDDGLDYNPVKRKVLRKKSRDKSSVGRSTSLKEQRESWHARREMRFKHKILSASTDALKSNTEFSIHERIIQIFGTSKSDDELNKLSDDTLSVDEIDEGIGRSSTSDGCESVKPSDEADAVFASHNDQSTPLFERIFIIELVQDHKTNGWKPEIHFEFPPNPERLPYHPPALANVPHFCFPDAETFDPKKTVKLDDAYSFILTSENGEQSYGYCQRFINSKTSLPQTYCIVSKLGCFGLFSNLVKQMYDKLQQQRSDVYRLCSTLREAKVPLPGETVTVLLRDWCNSSHEQIFLERAKDPRLEHVNFMSLLLNMAPKNIIAVFSSLLLERRVILCSNRLSALSSCANALRSLLCPFKWEYPFIPFLPQSMGLEFYSLPSPYFMGAYTNNAREIADIADGNVVVVDLDNHGKLVKKMGDESQILPKQLYSCLKKILSDRKNISAKDVNGCVDTYNSLVGGGFLHFFVRIMYGYENFVYFNDEFFDIHKEEFCQSRSKETGNFLREFSETTMFTQFVAFPNELNHQLFKQQMQLYRDSLQIVNKSIKGV